MRVSHDSDPASGHEPCPKPLPNPNPNPRSPAIRHVRRIEAASTGGPAWPQQRKSSARVGHPVDRYGQRALFIVCPPNPNQTAPAANLCSRSRPPSRPAAPAAPLLLSSRSPASSPIKTAPQPCGSTAVPAIRPRWPLRASGAFIAAVFSLLTSRGVHREGGKSARHCVGDRRHLLGNAETHGEPAWLVVTKPSLPGGILPNDYFERQL